MKRECGERKVGEVEKGTERVGREKGVGGDGWRKRKRESSERRIVGRERNRELESPNHTYIFSRLLQFFLHSHVFSHGACNFLSSFEAMLVDYLPTK